MNARLGNSRHPLSERGNDVYETPAVAVHALLRVEPWIAGHPGIWEPACGPGAIVRVLRHAGAKVVATDLVDYGSPDQDAGGRDFLTEREAPAGVTAIVTNPPFKIADQFIRKSLEMCPTVVALLRFAFAESERRSDILDGGRLARVYVFSRRLPMMHRMGCAGRKANSGTAFAWFVWGPPSNGPTELRRLKWEPLP